MTRKIRGILFDLGDTLLDFGGPDISAQFEAGTHLAYDYLRDLNQPVPSFAKYHRKQYWSIQWHYVISRITRREFNSLDLMRRLSRQMGQHLTHEQLLELAWLWYEPLSRCATVEDNLRETLEEFRERGITLGLLSNTFLPEDVLDRHLRREGLLDLLPVRVYSCQVRFRKPARRIFQIALEKARLEPSETLFVGDMPKIDIIGANRAGLVSVLKDPQLRHVNSKVKAQHRIRRIEDLREVLAGYNGRCQPGTA